jgi:hypothetical protein
MHNFIQFSKIQSNSQWHDVSLRSDPRSIADLKTWRKLCKCVDHMHPSVWRLSNQKRAFCSWIGTLWLTACGGYLRQSSPQALFVFFGAGSVTSVSQLTCVVPLWELFATVVLQAKRLSLCLQGVSCPMPNGKLHPPFRSSHSLSKSPSG